MFVSFVENLQQFMETLLEEVAEEGEEIEQRKPFPPTIPEIDVFESERGVWF